MLNNKPLTGLLWVSKTAKTTTVLQLAYIIQAMVAKKKLIKKVLIFDPMFHESFEPAGIRKAIGFINPNFVLPNYKVITVDEIQSYGASKEDYYCWAVVRDRGKGFRTFVQEALTLKNAITILDDVGSRITERKKLSASTLTSWRTIESIVTTCFLSIINTNMYHPRFGSISKSHCQTVKRTEVFG
jgi:hypothetical protein